MTLCCGGRCCLSNHSLSGQGSFPSTFLSDSAKERSKRAFSFLAELEDISRQET